MDGNASCDKKFDTVLGLLHHLLALELTSKGVTQQKFGRHIHVAKATVAKTQEGVKHDG